MARWKKGERTVQFLISRGRLENVEVEDLAASADALIGRAALRVEATAAAGLKAGDVDGAYVAAYDAWAIEKATAALSDVKVLLAASPPERFN